MFAPIDEVQKRIARAEDDSDVAYFYELLHAGEMAMKVTVAALVACLEDDRDRHRYRLEYELVRSDGLGGWGAALEDCLTGPASQALAEDARDIQTELSQGLRLRDGVWGSEAVHHLRQARLAIDADIEELPSRVAIRRWFADFTALRNRTRGHGATTPATCSKAAPQLRTALDLLLGNLTVFQLPWAHLRRNLSGKYRVTDLGNGGDQAFAHLRSSKEHALRDGVFLWVGSARPVDLITSDEDVRDFYVPNGGSTGQRYELLSYITDSKLTTSIDRYIVPPTRLPQSETQGASALVLVGNVLCNLPPDTRGYISRRGLEDELAALLRGDRHPVITLVGRGGIGKTSLALHVLYSIANEDRFFSIVWFSSRDIELLPEGPKLVRPHLLSAEDMAREYVDLVQPPQAPGESRKPLDAFAEALGENTKYAAPPRFGWVYATIGPASSLPATR